MEQRYSNHPDADYFPKTLVSLELELTCYEAVWSTAFSGLLKETKQTNVNGNHVAGNSKKK